MFSWLRTQVRNAVLAGCGDAAQELVGERPESDEQALAFLREQVLVPRGLPAPKAELSANGRAKHKSGVG